jgi:hypothetical protein
VPAGSVELKVRTTAACASMELELDEPEGTYLTTSSCDGLAATFRDAAPGNYRACVDRSGCIPIIVTEEPVVQTIDLR